MDSETRGDFTELAIFSDNLLFYWKLVFGEFLLPSGNKAFSGPAKSWFHSHLDDEISSC